MKLPTVKIATEDGYAIINEADYDPKKHKPFEQKTTPKKKQK
ncbi:hypothetical protein CLV77_1408 [Brevirhabdus pacifica]|nr:hypothetical protein [Brevirhabdus pacifica]PJJ86848.1 hypothetical protein CLV77_1408 [Brevirhabdus pacifica]